MNNKKYEKLASLFLRLNGYFLVDNFIVHAGDDDSRISDKGLISQHTEMDTLGIRMPYQKEISGNLYVINFESLILDNGKTDFVIVESKTGKSNKPNRTWTNIENVNTVKYILNFFGVFKTDDEIEEAANELLNNFSVERDEFSFRYIIISETVNDYYAGKGVKFITYDSIIDFIVKIRGECWVNTQIGISSYHGQWDDFMRTVFELANDFSKSYGDRKETIRIFLNE